MRRPCLPVLACLALLLAGCANLGPKSVQAGRADYNTVLRDTADQQLLENLVRLRYRDRPFFLEVASVTTQFSYNSRVTPLLNFDGALVDNDVITELEGAYAETPTIAYTPLQGDAFARRILAPISLESFVLLGHSGWSAARLLRVCVQRLNDVPNAVSASGPTPEQAPDYARFLAVAEAVRELQLRDQITFGAVPGENGPEFALLVTHGGEGTEPYARLVDALGLERGRTLFRVQNALRFGDDDTVNVQTRSMNGILYFLSHAVEVPAEHLERGWVTRTVTEAGSPFDWNTLTRDLLTIRSGSRRPDDASVATRYRGTWFWIADDDLDSKSTFSLLMQLFALQAGSADGGAPVLTLPVGG
jgi:hypothetical protein